MEPWSQVPLLEIDFVVWILEMDLEIGQEVVYKVLNLDNLKQRGIAKVRHLKNLILSILQRQNSHELLRNIK
jgi:hypothetical protein